VNEDVHPYVTEGLWPLIERALQAAGKNPGNVTNLDTAPFDHFHTGGLEASKDLLQIASAVQPAKILDLGAGIGGASRFLAEFTSASITSLDFEPEFCSVNRRLTEAVGYSSEIEVIVGDGTRLPFNTESFDWVWMQQAAMNIADKEALYSEIARVLRPGGQFVFQEVVAGPMPGPLKLPTPWAAAQEDSHLEPAESMRTRLQRLGIHEVAFEDVTMSLMPGLQQRVDHVRANGAPALGVHLLSTSDLLPIVEGMLLNAKSGRIAFVRGVYRRS
jgi:ubiquinone/menaquinone biosynthesis C-methylase UbiE